MERPDPPLLVYHKFWALQARGGKKMKSVLTIILVYVIVRNVIRHFWG